MKSHTTPVLSVQFEPNHQGELIAFIKLERLKGVINHRTVTVTNMKDYSSLDLHRGDRLIVDDKIGHDPVVIETDSSGRPSHANKLGLPRTCPSCHAPLHRNGKHLVCGEADTCQGVMFTRLKRLVSPDGLELDRLSDYQLRVLSETGGLVRATDLLILTRLDERLKRIPSMDQSVIDFIKLTIDIATALPTWRVLYALGVADLSPEECRRIGNNHTLVEVSQLRGEQLRHMGLTDDRIKSMLSYFQGSPRAWHHDLGNLQGFSCLSKK